MLGRTDGRHGRRSQAIGTESPSAPRSDSSFSFGDISGRFNRAPPLDEYVRNVIVEPALWASLVAAIGDDFAGAVPPAGKPVVGVIMSADPLLAVAGAGLFGRGVCVPMQETEQLPRFDTLTDALGRHNRLGSWVELSAAHPEQADGPLLMRAWEAAPVSLATEFNGVAGLDAAALRGGVLCLMRAPRPGKECPSFRSFST